MDGLRTKERSEMNEIVLGISGLPQERAKKCVQELFPIANGEFKKSINGNLLFVETSDRQKYRSVISCSDLFSPVIDKIWIGTQINVGCIQNLWQVIYPGETELNLIRPAVIDSINVIDRLGKEVQHLVSGNQVILKKPSDKKTFVSFRPWLTMMVTNFSMKTNEWAMECGWKLESEEI